MVKSFSCFEVIQIEVGKVRGSLTKPQNFCFDFVRKPAACSWNFYSANSHARMRGVGAESSKLYMGRLRSEVQPLALSFTILEKIPLSGGPSLYTSL